jgi:beta-lactam-binding protein with PASTA domain
VLVLPGLLGSGEPPPPTTVGAPNLSGMTVTEAQAALTAKGLKLGTQDEQPSDTVEEG